VQQREIILKNLQKKWQQQALAQFYIIRCHQQSAKSGQFLNNFVDQFLTFVYSEETHRPWQGKKFIRAAFCADWLFLARPEKKGHKAYTQDEFAEFFKFQTFAPFEHRYKFCIVEDAHLINTVLANKLLKILEELQKNTVIIFLIPGDFPLLPTIESRAIQFSLPLPQEHLTPANRPANWREDCLQKIQNNDFLFSKKIRPLVLDLLQGRSTVPTLVQAIKNSSQEQNNILQLCLYSATMRDLHYVQLEELLAQIQWFQESDRYSNNAQQRLFGLLNNVFP